MESESVERWKALITEARELYSKMVEEDAEACDNWLDAEYVKIPGSEGDGTIENVVASNPEHAVKVEGEK